MPWERKTKKPTSYAVLSSVKCLKHKRCGKHSYHATHRVCAACGFGKTSKIKSNSWQWKSPVGKGNRKK